MSPRAGGHDKRAKFWEKLEEKTRPAARVRRPNDEGPVCSDPTVPVRGLLRCYVICQQGLPPRGNAKRKGTKKQAAGVDLAELEHLVNLGPAVASGLRVLGVET